MSDRAAVRFRVAGRVQGVGFRWSAVRAATGFGVGGWVTNRPDGAVEGYACGAGPALEKFCAWLRRGPAGARVEQCDLEPAAIEAYADFSIR